MIKQLRLKFVLINMSIVTAMLFILFFALYYSTERNLEKESLQAMQIIAADPLTLGGPGTHSDSVRLPYFTILVNHAGEAAEVGGGFFDLSDETVLQQYVKEALETHRNSGVLSEDNLRFYCTESRFGRLIVFADRTSEQSTLHHLLRTFIIGGIAAFLLFLGISILLSRWAVRPMETAWKQQRQFVADASHELKTPLTVITTRAELLRSSECPEEEREILTDGILTMSRRMKGLVEQMLTLARLDAGQIGTGEFRVLSLSEVLENASLMFEPVFFEKGLTLTTRITPDLQVKGDPDHLTQLVEILLDNAGKYSLPGGETVLQLRSEGHKLAGIEVSNPGAPLSEEEQENIFTRFYRADPSRSGEGSYGLGLAIAQSIAQEHGSRLTVKSTEGINTFHLELHLI